MRKKLVITLLLCLVLCGCSCKHEWSGADCTSPATCIKCGESHGAPLQHNIEMTEILDVSTATLTKSEKCSSCGILLSNSVSDADKLYSGQQFLFTPDEFCERLDLILSENYGLRASGPISMADLEDGVYYGIYDTDWILTGGIICFDQNRELCQNAGSSDVCSVIVMSTGDPEVGLDIITSGIKAIDPLFPLSESDSTLRKLAQSSIIQNGIYFCIMESGDSFSLYAYPDS